MVLAFDKLTPSGFVCTVAFVWPRGTGGGVNKQCSKGSKPRQRLDGRVFAGTLNLIKRIYQPRQKFEVRGKKKIEIVSSRLRGSIPVVILPCTLHRSIGHHVPAVLYFLSVMLCSLFKATNAISSRLSDLDDSSILDPAEEKGPCQDVLISTSLAIASTAVTKW